MTPVFDVFLECGLISLPDLRARRRASFNGTAGGFDVTFNYTLSWVFTTLALDFIRGPGLMSLPDLKTRSWVALKTRP